MRLGVYGGIVYLVTNVVCCILRVVVGRHAVCGVCMPFVRKPRSIVARIQIRKDGGSHGITFPGYVCRISRGVHVCLEDPISIIGGSGVVLLGDGDGTVSCPGT